MAKYEAYGQQADLEIANLQGQVETANANYSEASRQRDSAVQALGLANDALRAANEANSTLKARVLELETALRDCQAQHEGKTLKVGTTVARMGRETMEQAYARRTQELGVEPEAVRVFYTAGPPAKWPNLGKAVEIVSFKRSPAEVLSGRFDSEFRAFWESIPADGEEHIWCYWHEPEDNIEAGDFTANIYKQATAYLNALSKTYLKPEQKAVHAQIFMAWSIRDGSGRDINEYVERSVDAIGWDAYTAADTEAIYRRAANVSISFGKRYFIAEAGKRATGGNEADNAAHVLSASEIAAALGFEYFTYFDTREWLFDSTLEWAAMKQAIERDLPLGKP